MLAKIHNRENNPVISKASRPAISLAKVVAAPGAEAKKEILIILQRIPSAGCHETREQLEAACLVSFARPWMHTTRGFNKDPESAENLLSGQAADESSLAL